MLFSRHSKGPYKTKHLNPSTMHQLLKYSLENKGICTSRSTIIYSHSHSHPACSGSCSFQLSFRLLQHRFTFYFIAGTEITANLLSPEQWKQLGPGAQTAEPCSPRSQRQKSGNPHHLQCPLDTQKCPPTSGASSSKSTAITPGFLPHCGFP